MKVVALDIETTSLAPAEGEIIEVAAIRYDLATGEEVERWEHLMRPLRTAVSQEITTLTGITQAMVVDAEPFATWREDLRSWLGDDTLLAHNASFDIGWLAYHGLSLANPVWDTFWLASLAWPNAESYNLGTLAAEHQLRAREEHRAAADAVRTLELFLVIREHLEAPAKLKGTVTDILTKAQAKHYLPLFTFTDLTSHTPSPYIRRGERGEVEGRATESSLEEIFSAQGPIAKAKAAYVPRPAQLQAAQVIAKLIADRQAGFIEAGTGVGKTYVYLVPACAKASAGKPVIISTYTRHLQDQLVERDIPQICQWLGLSLPVAILKGRRNYICKNRLAHYLLRTRFTPAEAFSLLKIVLWLAQGGSGDVERLNLSHQAEWLLRKLHADTPVCRDNCSAESGCPYAQARAAIDHAAVIVINHALLANLPAPRVNAANADRGVLSRATALIVDEAHHVVEAVRQATFVDLSLDEHKEVFGFTKEKAAVPPQHIEELLEKLPAEYTQLLGEMGDFVMKRSPRGRLLLTGIVRRSAGWQAIVRSTEAWTAEAHLLFGLLQSWQDDLPPRARLELATRKSAAEGFVRNVNRFVSGDRSRIQWIEAAPLSTGQAGLQVKLNDGALHVQSLMQGIVQQAPATILVSATLTVSGKFDYIKRETGLVGAHALRIESNQTGEHNLRIYCVSDAPLPGSEAYEQFVAQQIEKVALTLGGRTLALCTSKAAVKNIYYKLMQPLNKATIRLLAQGMTGGRAALLRRFREIPESVLLGVESFWEGIDVPGSTLSCIIIPKLPFPVVDDPVITAQAQALGTSSFSQFSLPRMLLMLRQGIGRLIREPGDRGVIIILDSRIFQRGWGSAVFDNFPPASVAHGPAASLEAELEQWFGPEALAAWRKSPGAPKK